jgi:hypothetical protein
LLVKPASQAAFGSWITTLQGLKHGYTDNWRRPGKALMQGKPPRNKPLPYRQAETQQSQAAEDRVQKHRRFVALAFFVGKSN